IQERVGTTFLVVTHDQEEALGLASRIAVMNRGELVQIGTPAEIYERPRSRFVADFVGAVNLFDGRLINAFNALALKVAGIDEPIPLPEPVNLPVDAAVAIAVRPENMRLSPARPAGFALAATIISVGYQGGQSTVHLSTTSGRSLRTHLPSAAALALAALATALCLLVGYAIAFAIARTPGVWRQLLLFLVMLPFWTSFLIRVYAWIAILQPSGLINRLLLASGVIEAPLPLLYNDFSVTLGLVYSYLPFMILPLYGSLSRLDESLVEA